MSTGTENEKRGTGILVMGEPKETKKEYAELAKQFKVQQITAPTRSEQIAAIRAAASDPSARWDTVLFPFGSQKGPIDEELLGPLKGQLRFVAGIGAGYDTVDTRWLESVGAWYCNTPESVSDTTATTAVTLILICLRHATSLMASTKAGKWRGDNVLTPDARGFVVGIIGMGTIGKLVSKKVQALGMKVIYYNRKRLPESEENGATYVSWADLLTQSQLITIHCPLTPSTHHLLSTSEFSKMRRGIMIVNTSRGPVIDEKALCEALRSEQVSRVGLDVFENEPEIEPYLRECERAALFPHFGSATVRLHVDTELEGLSNFWEWVRGGRPKNGVNDPVGKGKATL